MTTTATRPTSMPAAGSSEWAFPRLPVHEIRLLVECLVLEANGAPMTREALLQEAGLNDTPATREKLDVATEYGLTTGGNGAGIVVPTELGRRLIQEAETREVYLEMLEAIDAFRRFHTDHAERRVPAHRVLVDWATALGIPRDQAERFIGVVLVNAREAGLIQGIDGEDAFVSFEQVRHPKHPGAPPDGHPLAPPLGELPGPFTIPVQPAGKATAPTEVHLHLHLAPGTTPEQIETVMQRLRAQLAAG